MINADRYITACHVIHRPGWEQIDTGVEHCTPFLPAFPQACGEFYTP